MRMFLRQLLSIVLPLVVVVLVPHWLLDTHAVSDSRWPPGTPLAWLPRSAGVLLFVLGFALSGWCVSLFARVGRGTLAPWDPTRELVAAGPYRFVRNPMISGVVSMLTGEALFWGSAWLGLWALAFFTINHLYFVLAEEPGLEKRFGESYRAYQSRVPRWIPRRPER